MVGFRVLVNLCQYFSDHRQKSWVYVDPNRFETLSDLKKHISEVFAIDNDFEVFVCDSYIPSKEDVRIIKENDVLELKKATGVPDVTAALRDVFSTPISVEEGESRKKRKKRKNDNLDSQLDTDQSSEKIDPLPESFHPEYNSTMNARKKRKKTKNSSPTEEFSENSSVCSSKKLCEKKSSVTKENCWNAKEVAYSSTVQIPNEKVEGTPVCMDVGDEASSTIKSASPTKHRLETIVKDFISSEVKEVSSDRTCNPSSAQSIFENSLLEHTIFEGAQDIAEREGEIVERQKRKRSRRGRRKPKKISSDNPKPVLDHTADISNALVYPCKHPSLNTVSDSRKHMRFSDSGDEEVSALQTTENNSIDTTGRIKNCSSEPNGAVGVDTTPKECPKPSSNLSKGYTATSVVDEKTNKYDVQPHHQILRYNDTKNKSLQNSSLLVSRRRKKAVLNTGLGATLAHLMKNAKTPEACFTSAKPSDLKAVIKTEPSPSVPDKLSSSKKNYAEFPIIEKFPKEGDILAFKILKMNDHYEPCISNVVECLVTACDQNQLIITIKILEGVKEFDRVNGKFEVLLDEEEEKTESNDVVLTVEWKDLIEPRLIFP